MERSLGNHLKDSRLDQGLCQGEVAEQLGVTRRTGIRAVAEDAARPLDGPASLGLTAARPTAMNPLGSQGRAVFGNLCVSHVPRNASGSGCS